MLVFRNLLCSYNTRSSKKFSETPKILLRLNMYVAILLILSYSDRKMVKGEITESESTVQSLTSKENSPAIYFFLSLLN